MTQEHEMAPNTVGASTFHASEIQVLALICFQVIIRVGKQNHKTSTFAFRLQFSKLKILLLAFSFSIIFSAFAFRFSLSKSFSLFT